MTKSSSPPPKASSSKIPPSKESRDRTVLRWAAVVDRIDYLSLLRLARDRAPSEGEVRRAYRIFARAFHPDGYRASPDQVREAAAKVFAVGADAHRILADAPLRAAYLRAHARGVARPKVEDLEREVRSSAERSAQVPAARLARTDAARQAAARADKMLAIGELAYARAALAEALAIEPRNEALVAKLEAIDARLFSAAPARGRR
jgi:curved DNA-binding protein CbpA